METVGPKPWLPLADGQMIHFLAGFMATPPQKDLLWLPPSHHIAQC